MFTLYCSVEKEAATSEYGHPAVKIGITLFYAHIYSEYGHPAVCCTKLRMHLDAHKHVYKPYADTAVNFDFHRLAYISMMTT